MMEAMKRGKATPDRLRVYCDKQREGNEDDSIRERERRESNELNNTHTWTTSEETRANY